MDIFNYVIWLIIGPLVAAFLAITICKKIRRLIYFLQELIILFFTFVDIIQNHPYGNMSQQLRSYFGNMANNFYVKYLPFLLITIIVIKIYDRNKKN
jgi:hypothetical protein